MLLETAFLRRVLVIACLTLVVLVRFGCVVQDISQHLVGGVQHSFLVGVLLQAADVLGADVLVVHIVRLRDLRAAIACRRNSSVRIVLC